jgi:hypothetical protein
MPNIGRQAWRKARAMTRRSTITNAIGKQLGWIRTADIAGVTRLRCADFVVRWSAADSAPLADGASTIEVLHRAKR